MLRTATRTATAIGALGAATVLSLALVGCGGDTGTMDHSSMPSESSSTTSATPNGPPVDAGHNDQDVTFAQMMIVHHQGATEMAGLAADRASSPEVENLASTIIAAQQPEIAQMSAWLDAWNEPLAADSPMEGMEDMDHSSMPGMMTDEQMNQLQQATGPEFDRLFLQSMIAHHEGAVQMAEVEQQEGSNPQALKLADAIVVSQQAEIDRMELMLTALG